MNGIKWFEDPEATPAPGVNMAASKPQRRLRVLLVEDNPLYAQMIQHTLREIMGITLEVVWVETLAKGLAQLSQGGLDLVLLDLGLPDSQGIDTFVHFRGHAAVVPIVVLTGNADDDVALEAIRQGAQDYLVKGTDAASVVRAMRYAMGRHRMRRRMQRALDAVKANEADLRTIIDKNLDAIAVVNLHGVVLHANAAAEDLCGCQRGELPGQSWKLPLHAGASHEMDIVNRAGKRVPTELRVGEINWAGQRAHLVQLHDLTERKAVESNRQKLLLAREVQQSLLPKTGLVLTGFDLAAASITAEEVGGDYYDYVPMPDNCLGLALADASGHGFASALFITGTCAFLRAFASLNSDVGTLLTQLNRQLCAQSAHDQFVTAILTRIDPVARTLTYASAGHPAGLLLDATGHVRMELASLDIPLALEREHQFQSSAAVALQSGDVLVLISDGVLEAPGPAGAQFGTQRVLEFVRAHRHLPARTIVDSLCSAVHEFCAGVPLRDDVTVVVAHVV